jgi:hypothetical protein
MESSPVAKAIVQFLATHKRLTGQDEWKGLVSELHTELMNYDVYKDAKTAPKIANKLSGQLNRIKSSLYIQGIDVQLKKRIGKGVPVTLRRIPGVDKTPVGVDKTPVGVDKTPVGVDKTPVGVDKNDVSTPPFSLDESLIDGKYTGISVDSVDTLPSLTAFYPPVDEEKEEKRERNNGRAVREENLSTPSTPSTPPDDAAIPDSYIYSEPCEKCDCGIYRPLDGSEVCIRCYPPKGYHAYKHLVDTMFPRKQHAVFGKEKI